MGFDIKLLLVDLANGLSLIFVSRFEFDNCFRLQVGWCVFASAQFGWVSLELY